VAVTQVVTSLSLPHITVSFQLVGSAPHFPHGIIDPIEDIAKVTASG